MGCVFELGVLFGCLTFSTAEVHTLQYFYTATSGISNFPEFISFGMVDGVVISSYDSVSRNGTPKQSWMKMDQEYWESETSVGMGQHHIFMKDIEILKARFNQTEGVLQKSYGCEWDDDTGATDGHELFGYDGKDFLTLDLNNMRWIATVPQAVLSKQRLDSTEYFMESRKMYFSQTCVEWLKTYVQYGSSTLGRKVRPEVSLFQRDSSVVCHATGFYPDGVMITLKKYGKEMQEDVYVGETLPNVDGTFQKRATLSVSPEERRKGQYTCEVAHKSGPPTIKTLTVEDGNTLGIIIGCVVAAALVMIGVIVGIVMMKGRKKDYKKAEQSDTDSENSNPIARNDMEDKIKTR